jgi:hypothetical protein
MSVHIVHDEQRRHAAHIISLCITPDERLSVPRGQLILQGFLFIKAYSAHLSAA